MKKIYGKDGKEYSEKTTTQPLPVKLRLEELTEQELNYIKDNIELAEALLNKFEIINNTHAFDPELLGKAVMLWFDKEIENQFDIDINIYSNAIAAGWGKYLEEKLEMKWYVITDEFGTEIGLYHPNNNTTVFPFNSIEKAFKNQDFSLLSIITDKTVEIITDKN